MTYEKVKVVIAGASGMVGREFARLLAGHPWFDVASLCGVTTAGKSYEMVWNEKENQLKNAYPLVWKKAVFPEQYRDWQIEYINVRGLREKNVRIAFSALQNTKDTEDLEQKLADNGIKVFSNVGCMRMWEMIPLIIGEVNPLDMHLVEQQPWYKRGGHIVKNANCTTIGLVPFLHVISRNFGLKGIEVVTMQALSGKGDDAYNSEEIIGNTYTFIKGEEDKVATEPHKIMHNGLFEIKVKCNRVYVQNGHLEDVFFETIKETSEEEVKEALRNFRNPLTDRLPSSPDKLFYVIERDGGPQQKIDVNNGRGMAISVGDFKQYSKKEFFASLVSHNLVRGAAGASIQNAELALSMGYV